MNRDNDNPDGPRDHLEVTPLLVAIMLHKESFQKRFQLEGASVSDEFVRGYWNGIHSVQMIIQQAAGITDEVGFLPSAEEQRHMAKKKRLEARRKNQERKAEEQGGIEPKP